MKIYIRHRDSLVAKSIMRRYVQVCDYEEQEFIFSIDREGDRKWSNAITSFYPAMPFKVNECYDDKMFILSNESNNWVIYIWTGANVETVYADDPVILFSRLEDGSLENWVWNPNLV